MFAYFFVIVSAILFGTTGIAIGFVGNEINPFLLTFYRCFIGLLTLMVICPLVDSNTFNIKDKRFKEEFLIGFFIALSTTLAVLAYQNASVSLVTIIAHIYPAITVLLAAIFLSEKLTTNKIASIVIAFLGIAVINPLGSIGGQGLGIFYSVILAFVSAITIIYMRKTKTTRTLGSTFWFFLFASILTSPGLYFYDGLSQLSMGAILGSLWVGVVGVGLAYLYYDKGFENADAGLVSIISLVFTPLVAVLGSAILLGEELTLRMALGGLLLLCSAVALQFFSRIQLHIRYRRDHISSTMYNQSKKLWKRIKNEKEIVENKEIN